MVSCQKEHLAEPDAETMQNMKDVSSVALAKQHGANIEKDDIKIDAHGIMLGTQTMKAQASEVSKHRMARNCKKTGYNLNNIVSYNKFTCRYLGEGVDDKGRKVQNPFQTWRGTLASCDDTLEISDDVEHDVRMLAWEAAGGAERKMNPDQMMCSIQSLPMQ